MVTYLDSFDATEGHPLVPHGLCGPPQGVDDVLCDVAVDYLVDVVLDGDEGGVDALDLQLEPANPHHAVLEPLYIPPKLDPFRLQDMVP